MRYRKKPTTIEAIRYDGSNFPELVAWTEGAVREATPAEQRRAGRPAGPPVERPPTEAPATPATAPPLIVVTPTGEAVVRAGDWVARQPLETPTGTVWDFWPIDADQFEATYDAVDDETELSVTTDWKAHAQYLAAALEEAADVIRTNEQPPRPVWVAPLDRHRAVMAGAE